MAGPGIRYWEFARVLSEYFSVTLAVPPYVNQKTAPIAPFAARIMICKKSEELYTLAEETDVIVTLGIVLSLYPKLLKIKKPLVVDIYIPSIIESLHSYSEIEPTERDLFLHERQRNTFNTQLRMADFMICASEKQRDYWLGMLTTLGRINPYTHNDDKTLRRLIDVVPFGLPRQKAVHTNPVLKGVHPGIKPDDKVLIWTGGIWDWLDAPTLIKALPLVLQTWPNAKLFFMGVKRPFTPKIGAADVAIALSQELELYDRHIFFNDWVPYEERQNYLLEADLGVSLHLNHIETRFSFRTRFLDHLWTGLPLLATEGDVMSAELVKLKLACTVKAGDIEGVARGILEMLNDYSLRQNYLIKIDEILVQYQWETVARPLIEFCAQPYFAPDKAYLNTIPVVEVGPTSIWRLLQKAWLTLKKGGLDELLWRIKTFILWKLGK
jgi:glycosyltransferase involved in cell wall biosynthesis